jgi:predicted ATPase
MPRKQYQTKLDAPYLKRVTLQPDKVLKGYPFDHAGPPDRMPLANALRLGWLPKVSDGWFFTAETFFGLASYLDQAGSSADFLSHSHGEGFMRVFEERMSRQGVDFMADDTESQF